MADSDEIRRRHAKADEYCRLRGFQVRRINGERLCVSVSALETSSAETEAEARTSGCEVHVGRLPQDLFEDELLPMMQTAGAVRMMRIKLELSGKNRRYAFVTFELPSHAVSAVRELDGAPVRTGARLSVNVSTDTKTLGIGGVAPSADPLEICDRLGSLVDGIVGVRIFRPGAALVDFATHADAARARTVLIPAKPRIWGVPLRVDWIAWNDQCPSSYELFPSTKLERPANHRELKNKKLPTCNNFASPNSCKRFVGSSKVVVDVQSEVTEAALIEISHEIETMCDVYSLGKLSLIANEIMRDGEVFWIARVCIAGPGNLQIGPFDKKHTLLEAKVQALKIMLDNLKFREEDLKYDLADQL